jgi:regulator of RNase E activity RraA
MIDERSVLGALRMSLGTAVLGDVLDAAGCRNQFLPPHLTPVIAVEKLVGRAMTVMEQDTGPEAAGEPFGLMFRALDDLKPGEIYLCTGSLGAYALWGELMSTRAMSLGAVGAIVDGYHRDTVGIRSLGFPVYSRGAYAQDQRSRGRVADFRCGLTFANGTRVADGDIIVADADGVLAIPANILDDVVAAALAKSGAERDIQQMIRGGEGTEAIFNRTGIM